jgi:hypothetical protein
MRRAALVWINADVPILHRQDAAWSVSNINDQDELKLRSLWDWIAR